MAVCWNCGDGTIIVDPDSGARVCNDCGIIHSDDDFRHQAFTSDGHATGSLVHSFGDFGYRERKIHRASVLISDVTARLGLSSARAAEVSALASDATDGNLGEGDWFPVFIAACSYLVARRNRLPLSLAEAAAAVGRDAYEIGGMAVRVARHLDLPPLPDFDAASALERVIRTCPCFSDVSSDKAEEMIGQGRFLLQCSTKWFLTTGRRPLPMLGAIAAFVGEVNQVEVSLEAIAKALYANVSTSKRRLKELMETLVSVANALLPWGQDVTVKNLVQNAPLLIRCMEMRSKSKSDLLDGFGYGGALTGYPNDEEDDSNYFKTDTKDGLGCIIPFDDLENIKLSGDCLSSVSKKLLERIAYLKKMGEIGKDRGEKRRKQVLDIDVWSSSSKGRWDSDKKLTLEQVLERDVGYEALPPSFTSGLEARKQRKAKIKAAKRRICEIVNPDSGIGIGVEEEKQEEQMIGRKRSRRKKGPKDGIDMEDCIIELLLLHRVDEEEIEGGQYNRLLDLHVFA